MATKRKVMKAPRPRTVGALLRAAGACRRGSRPFNGFPNTAAGRRAALVAADDKQLFQFAMLALSDFVTPTGVPSLFRVCNDPECARTWMLANPRACYAGLLGRVAWNELTYRQRYGAAG